MNKVLPVVGYEQLYTVSDHGEVCSLDVLPHVNGRQGKRGKRARTLKPARDRQGRLRVALSNGHGHVKTYLVSRLMATAFFGPSELQVRHLDDNPGNNVLSNLAYGTQSMNEYDKIRNGNHFPTTKTHCKRGHEFTFENIRRDRNGYRQCRTCDVLRRTPPVA